MNYKKIGGGRTNYKRSLSQYKQEQLSVARQLGYGEAIQRAIVDAETEAAVTRAMIKGRQQMA